MNMKRLLVLLLLLFASSTVRAEGIDIQKLAQDTQRFHQDKRNLDMVWWIPNEYWENTFKASPTLTAEKQKEFITVVDDYIIFAVLEGKIGMVGGMTATSRENLLPKITVDVKGKTLTPLLDDELSDDLQNLLDLMKPMFANMLGQVGQGMEFVVFEGKDEKGVRYADPLADGFLTLNLSKKEFKWRLPLGCFMPPKYDPATAEDFPGNYNFSPYTGAKLVTEKPAPAPATEATAPAAEPAKVDEPATK